MAITILSRARSWGRWLPFGAALLGIALFAVMDALMKRASTSAGVYPALFARSVAGAVVLGPCWWITTGGRLPPAATLRLHALRGLIVAAMAASFFYGIVRTPLAQGIALSFVAPLLALGLASAVLGEVIRRSAISAALLGLAGVAVIAWGRLGADAPSHGAVIGLAAVLLSALLYAGNLVVQRRQAQLAGPIEVALSQNLVIIAVLLPVAGLLAGAPGLTLRELLVPPVAVLPDVVGAALLASVSLMLLAWAYARAETQALVPMEYTAFGWAALMGWWWFGEVVTGWTLAGLVLIMAGAWLGTRSAVRA